MTTQFTDPAPPAPAGDQFADPAPAPQKIKRDRFGRYLLPHPDTGEEQAWTRVTTLAGTLEDTYNLQAWGERSVAKGVALRPDLAALAANLDVSDDKEALNRLAKDAKEAAGGSSGANLGTALHKVTEKVDAGERVVIPPAMAGEIQAYRDTLAREGVRVDPAYLERVVCVPELGVVGTLDKLLAPVAGGPYQVADLKSQKSMDFGGLKIAVQQAVYAHAYAVWDPVAQRWVDPPAIDQVLATIIWLPVGRRLCELYDVDLVWGWKMAKKSLEVRNDRKVKPVTRRTSMAPVPPPTFREDGEPNVIPDYTRLPADDAPVPTTLPTAAAPSSRPDLEGPAAVATVSWEARFRAARTPEELTEMGRAAMAAHGGALPDHLMKLGRVLRDVLKAENTP